MVERLLPKEKVAGSNPVSRSMEKIDLNNPEDFLPLEKLWGVVEKEIKFETFKASAPGGQKMQATQSGVRLRWNIFQSKIDNEAKNIIYRKLKRGIEINIHYDLTERGEILITSQEERSTEQNKQRALEKLKIVLQEALTRDKPRIQTQPPLYAKRKRLEEKRRRSEIKKGRAKKFNTETI